MTQVATGGLTTDVVLNASGVPAGDDFRRVLRVTTPTQKDTEQPAFIDFVDTEDQTDGLHANSRYEMYRSEKCDQFHNGASLRFLISTNTNNSLGMTTEQAR